MKKTDRKKYVKCKCNYEGGMAYFVGFIGATVYYLQIATGFWSAVLGILKAMVWPAFVTYGLLKFLGM